MLVASAVAVIALAYGAWLAHQVLAVRDHLKAARGNLEILEAQLATGHVSPDTTTLQRLQSDANEARAVTSTPGWKFAVAVPQIGPNFQTASELSVSVDDIVDRAIVPLLSDADLLDFEALAPSNGAVNLEQLQRGAPKLIAAANVVQLSYERLSRIESSVLVSQISEPLAEATEELGDLSRRLDVAASAAKLAPAMLGSNEQRRYLLLVQNNAELRATGGIPGALAVLTLNNGTMTLEDQTTASALGQFVPPIPTDAEQNQLYTARLGRYMQDVNLTPHFPTAAQTAQAMWEKNTGEKLSGVLSIDPITLGYLIDASGPISLTNPDLIASLPKEFPKELTGDNVVPTLLSEVYTKIREPQLQDAYFAGVAEATFRKLLSGSAQPNLLLQKIAKATDEGRIRLWSTTASEQSLIASYPLGGSVAGPNVQPSEFGVYFNDGTGAKMDYYVQRTVQLRKKCPADGYEQVTVRVTSTNTAPLDAATSLPSYVTGAGDFGVPPGSVQTNIVVYGPVQALVETAQLDGQKTEFAPHRHDARPVGVLAVRLAPGESKTAEFTFSKIVQHTEPNLVVTPTVQPVKDVTLPIENASCP
ncbi:DUF4012 domain-containing protein [Paenarthrobacter sp. NEAU-H11]|uniref:DUF4012 domain-containing protein n=1 Tax=Paenarthrobacter sp. NEAU-H11 TaxID=3423924 RepID=UPI003D341BC7